MSEHPPHPTPEHHPHEGSEHPSADTGTTAEHYTVPPTEHPPKEDIAEVNARLKENSHTPATPAHTTEKNVADHSHASHSEGHGHGGAGKWAWETTVGTIGTIWAQTKGGMKNFISGFFGALGEIFGAKGGGHGAGHGGGHDDHGHGGDHGHGH